MPPPYRRIETAASEILAKCLPLFSVVHQLLRQLLECIPAILLVVNGERQKKHILIREQFMTPGDYRLHDLRQRIAIRLFNRGEKRFRSDNGITSNKTDPFVFLL